MTQRYAPRQILAHWATVVLVLAQFLLHEGMSDAFERGMNARALTFSTPVIVHFALGTAILFLALLRLLMRNDTPQPPPPVHAPAWSHLAARATHLGFYVLLILLPVTGAVAWARASEMAGEVHETLRGALLVLIVLHVAAVVVHKVVWKESVLVRMLPGGRT